MSISMWYYFVPSCASAVGLGAVGGFYIRFADDCCWHALLSTQLVFFLGKLFQKMFGICQSDSGGGGGELWAGGTAEEDPLAADAALAVPIVLCSIFWLDEVVLLDCAACCDWEDTPAAAAAAAATANADKSFLFFLLRFRDVVAPVASTHITCCVWFFCVLLNLQAGVLNCNTISIRT